jgi:hypothetical protein
MEARVSKSFKLALGVRARANAKSAHVILGGKGWMAVTVLALGLVGCGSAPSPMQKWQTGPGGKCLVKVEQDLAATSDDFASKATTLLADAANCSVHAPPVGGAVFTTVMGDLSAAAVFSGGALGTQNGGDMARDIGLGNKSFSDARALLRQAPSGATWAPGLAKAMAG